MLDQYLTSMNIIDSFESVIWTDRYAKCGDFEIHTPMNYMLLRGCAQNNYLRSKDSEHIMIIESLQKETNIENGNNLIITGRSFESILYRRIIWAQTVIDHNVQEAIKKILIENVISPTQSGRKIDDFIFEDSTDPAITSLPVIKGQYMGDCVYDVIATICSYFDIGFKITLNTRRQFVFKLYAGVDHSYSQIGNRYVTFSPKFDNLLNSNYLESMKTLKNVTLVVGEGSETTPRKTTILGNASGVLRRELYIDASDISSNVNGVVISDADYIAQLNQRGYEKLVECQMTHTFEAQVDTTKTYKYGKDFYIGDIVQIEDADGLGSKARVEEVVYSEDKEGYTIYPTFTILENYGG